MSLPRIWSTFLVITLFRITEYISQGGGVGLYLMNQFEFKVRQDLNSSILIVSRPYLLKLLSPGEKIL